MGIPKVPNLSPTRLPAATALPDVAKGGKIETVFTRFVEGLRARGARHAFLRGCGHYPSVPEGSDVDMLVHPDDLGLAREAFHEAANETGFHIWQDFKSGFITRLFSYSFGRETGHSFFDVDLHTSEASYGVPYLTAAALLPFATNVGGVMRLSAPVEAMVNGLGHLFMGGRIPEKYARAWAAAGMDEASASLLSSVLNPSDQQFILEYLHSDRDERALRDGPGIGKRVRRRMLREHPMRSCAGFCAFGFGERVRPWFAPRGRFVIFAGTDGSGKTTLARELLARISSRFRDGRVEEHHLRPGVIPQISSLFHGGKPAYTIEDMEDPHRAEPSGFCGSSLRTLYYWVDYFIGYPLRILPRRRRNSLILYDRWFYDHVVDPRRFRIASGHPLPGLLTRWLAKPDQLIICSAPPELVLSRKQELAPEEVARQVEAFAEFGRSMPNTTIIDTSRDIESCVDTAIASIFGVQA